jgi:hypothetical protein
VCQKPKNEKLVCKFVRSILAAATDASIEVTGRPDQEDRSAARVEELWESLTHRFAIEHTLLESFVGQTEDDAKFVKLIAPIESRLAGRLSGTYALSVAVGASTVARVPYGEAHNAICDAVLVAAATLQVGKSVRLQAPGLDFPIHLFRRTADGSKIFVRRWVSDVEPSRLERARRALAAKSPKLQAARTDGRLSILALESNDIALANYQLVCRSVRAALKERADQPDLVIVVETDGGILYGWVVRNETGIPLKHCYIEGQF